MATMAVVVATMSAALVPPAHAAPAAPVITTVTPGNTTMTLAWDPVAGATSYQVQVDSGSPTTVTSPATVTGLTNGVEYSFVIIAVGSGSTPSEAVSARPGTPNAPTITGVTFTDTTMSVTYTPPTVINGSGAVVDYEFYLDGVRRPNASQTYSAPYPNPLVITTGGPVTGAYTVRMAATNDIGLGVFTTYTGTSSGSSGPAPAVPPLTPSITATSVVDKGFHINLLSGEGNVDAYYVQIGDEAPRGVNPNDFPIIISDRTPDTSHIVTVWATRGELTSPRTSIIVRTQAVPLPVTGLGIAQEPGLRASVTWQAPQAGAVVQAYRVEVAAGGVEMPCVGRTDPASTSCTTPGLRAGAVVSARVAAVGEWGVGPWTATSTMLFAERPGAPQVVMTPSPRGLLVLVRPTDLGGASGLSTIALLDVPRGSTATLTRSSACRRTDVQEGCYAIDLRTANTRELTITARVRTSGGTSEPTVVQAFLVEGEEVVTAPMNVVAVPGDGVVTVRWEPPLTTAPVRGFVVTRSDGTEVCETGPGQTSCSFAAANGERDSYRVRGFNASGAGELSAASSTVAPGAPTVPTVVAAERLTSTSARITWTASVPTGTADVTEYVVRTASGTELCRVAATERQCDVVVPATPVTLGLRAESGAGASASATVDLTQPLLPLPPTGLRFSVEAAPGSGAPVLVAQWTPVPGDPVATTYRVSAQGNPSIGCTVTAPADRCTISGVAPGVVTAFTVAGGVSGAYGKESEAVSAALDRPSSDSLRRAMQVGATSIEATWVAPAGSPSVTRIEARTDSGLSCSSPVGSLTCTITGVPPKSKQRVLMRAINAFGATDWLTRTNRRVDYQLQPLPSGGDAVWMRVLPAQPSDLEVRYTDGSLVVYWKTTDLRDLQTSDLVWDRPAGYRLYQISNPIGSFALGGSGVPTETLVCPQAWTACRLEVPNDVPYVFRLEAFNEVGTSESSYSPIVLATRDTAAPGAPTNVKVARTGPEDVRVSWTAPPRSAWGSAVPPSYSVIVAGYSTVCETRATSCTFPSWVNLEWLQNLIGVTDGQLPLEVIALNNAGSSARVSAVVPAYRR